MTLSLIQQQLKHRAVRRHAGLAPLPRRTSEQHRRPIRSRVAPPPFASPSSAARNRPSLSPFRGRHPPVPGMGPYLRQRRRRPHSPLRD
ncbi:hypothetical protein OG230_03460 [Streptomyces sp. NBC_00234]|uniref:hypothetical protein n=1 Tax=Streptomyces sp. NBC_00234 TaxID=2903638 RepID=UPI002E29692B|nr:hypothetical protein [Streptomyces sp. NBC_00234]